MADDALGGLLDAASKGDPAAIRAAASSAPLDDAGKLIDVLADEKAVGPLAALDSDDVPKAIRKLARRALHRLRSRGVKVPEPVRAAPKAMPAQTPAAIEATGWIGFTPPILRLVLTLRDRSAQRVCEAVLDERDRILAGGWFETSRKGIRTLLDDAERQGMPLAEIAAGHVAARLRDAAGRNASIHSDEASGPRDRVLRLMPFADPIAPADHPALEMAGPDDGAADAETLRAAGTLDTPDLVFPLDERLAGEFLASLNAVEAGPLVVSPHVAEERRAGVIRKFCEEKLDAEFCRGLALRHLDRAWLARAERDSEDARRDACVGAALLRRPGSAAAAAFLESFVRVHVRRGGEPPEPREE